MKKITLITILFFSIVSYAFAQSPKLVVDIYPNPFIENATLSYNLAQKEQITIHLYDAIGNLIQVVVDEMQQKGRYEYKIEVEKAGMYYVQITKNGIVETKRIMKN